MRKYHGNLESGTTRAQHVAKWYPAVLQDDVGCGRGSDAQLVLLLPQRKPWVWHGDQERTDALHTQSNTVRVQCQNKPCSINHASMNPEACALCLSFLSVVANTTVADASQELVIQALVPFSTHSSPSCKAVVEAAPASLPFPAVQIKTL